MTKTSRESDIISRWGGDEFVILFPETSRKSIEIIKDRLKNNISAFNAKEYRPYKLSISIGVSCYDPKNPCSINELLAQADKRMYLHKMSKKKRKSTKSSSVKLVNVQQI